jgi:ATP-dependent exoDNAse (exonuclease V) beta subunit
MTNIEIVSASAGSGKTYELARILEEAVRAGAGHPSAARPEAVIATTFTRKAAAELRERVRRRLLEAGLAEEAQRMNAAVMGTVNSVCSRFVEDFAFDLGLSPELRVLDEDAAAPVLRKALSEAREEERDEVWARLQGTFFEWQAEPLISQVMSLARANGMEEAELRASRDRCLAELDGLLGEPEEDEARLIKETVAAASSFLGGCKGNGDETKATAGAIDRARQFVADARAGRAIKWQQWAGLSHMGAGKRSCPLAEPVEALAARHVGMPSFKKDIEAAVYEVFDTAARALRTYREYKDEHGLIDFVDQERLALDLLDKPEARERLAGRFDLVLVDEFQDTSPIQLAIFLKLAGLAKRSVWVGDQKQSVYGFRGSDPELMNAAIDGILGGRKPRSLEKSWRSRPELVRVTSEVFARAFPRHDIPAERVRLEAAKPETAAGLGVTVERWYPRAAGRKKEDKTAALAAGIKELLADESVRVRDGRTGEARRAEARDVAVLCRTNKTAASIADGLAASGIKSAAARTGLMKTPEARLTLAGIRLWADPDDGLSAAEMARILDRPDDPDAWLAKLLRGPGRGAFGDVEAVRRIREVPVEERRGLGVLAAYDRIGEILGLRDLCRRWGSAGERLANLNVLRSYAVRYVKRAAEEGAGTALVGLATFLDEMDDGESDERAFSPGADAVIVSTWHRAKGLEWPIVVLYDLDWTWKRLVPGIHVASERERIELDDPLGERWIRYWPQPYHPGTKTAYHEKMEGHEAIEAAADVERRESLRLLYVGWTRARDRVVLAAGEGKLGEGMLGELRESEGAGGGGRGGAAPAAMAGSREDKSRERKKRGRGGEVERAGGADGEGRALLSEPEVDAAGGAVGRAVWAGVKIDVRMRYPEAAETDTPVVPEAEPTFVAAGPNEGLAPAKVRPNLEAMSWTAGEPEILGPPIRLKRARASGAREDGAEGETEAGWAGAVMRPGGVGGVIEADERRDETGFLDRFLSFGSDAAAALEGEKGRGRERGVDMRDLGSAVHAFIAADNPGYGTAARLRLAGEILARWKVDGALEAADVVEIGDRLRGWVEDKWPGAKCGREWPVFRRLESGSLMSGVTDLILETDEGIVIVDHKSYPGEPAEARELAAGDGGQVGAYAEAAAMALAKPVLGMFIHLPLLGVIVAIKRGDAK